MANRQSRFRQIHRTIAPVAMLPLSISLTTGTTYQFLDVIGKEDSFRWLLEIHVGNFSLLNLERIYPFLNALGLFTLIITGIFMWVQIQRKTTKRV